MAEPAVENLLAKLLRTFRKHSFERRATSPPSANLIAGWLLPEAAVPFAAKKGGASKGRI
jgi:hypothetical protein